MTSKLLGLSLSGGGARGLAHIGVLKVLERERIPVHVLSGASMGGILALLYASGLSAGELEEEALRMSSMRNLFGLIDIAPPRRGLVSGERVRKYFSKFIDPSLTFADLRIPVAVSAVDLQAAREISLAEGNLLDALMATSAFPGVFPAVPVQGRNLVDGGVLNNLPTHLLSELGANCSMAVDVSPNLEKDDPLRIPPELSIFPSFARELYHATQIMAAALTRARLEAHQPDLLLNPPLAPDVGIFVSFTRAAEIMAAGEAAAEAALPDLHHLLG